MNESTTEALVRRLSRNLEPVRPIPRLWVVATLAVALGVFAFTADLLLGGQGFRPLGDPAWARPSYWVILIGLGATAIGGLVGAAASSVPGRTLALRAGVAATVSGLALAIGAALVGLRGASAPVSADEILACLWCMGRAAEIGLLSLLAAAGFVAYAAALRLGASAALAVVGSVALGAAFVHVTCPNDDPLHHLVSHALTPVIAAGMITVPLAIVLKKLKRRGDATATNAEKPLPE